MYYIDSVPSSNSASYDSGTQGWFVRTRRYCATPRKGDCHWQHSSHGNVDRHSNIENIITPPYNHIMGKQWVKNSKQFFDSSAYLHIII
jgi:hypothetical protein